MSKRIEIEMLALDTKTGKELFSKKIEDPKYELMAMNGFDSDAEGNVFLFGTYYAKGTKELSKPSLGLFSLKLNLKGDVVSKKIRFMGWRC